MLQNHILKKIAANEKFFVGRLSGNEPKLAGRLLSKIELDEYLMHEMLFTAGIQFTNKDDIDNIFIYEPTCALESRFVTAPETFSALIVSMHFWHNLQ